jgi:hypothetical protein
MIYKYVLSYVALFAFLFINVPLMAAVDSQISATPSLNEWLEKRIDVNCNGRPLKEVMAEIAAFFETEIVYEAEGADLPVQCHYSQTTVEQTLDRLFRKQNRAILIEHLPKRKITVQVFGVSEYNIVSYDGSNRLETLPFLADMTNEALAAMQNEQFEAYQKELKDPSAIDPGVGITRTEITQLHEQQIEQQQRTQDDPEQIVAEMTITQQQLKVLHEQQLKQNEQDQDQIDPFTGLTNKEMSELHQQQSQQQVTE